MYLINTLVVKLFSLTKQYQYISVKNTDKDLALARIFCCIQFPVEFRFFSVNVYIVILLLVVNATEDIFVNVT